MKREHRKVEKYTGFTISWDDTYDLVDTQNYSTGTITFAKVLEYGDTGTIECI